MIWKLISSRKKCQEMQRRHSGRNWGDRWAQEVLRRQQQVLLRVHGRKESCCQLAVSMQKHASHRPELLTPPVKSTAGDAGLLEWTLAALITSAVWYVKIMLHKGSKARMENQENEEIEGHRPFLTEAVSGIWNEAGGDCSLALAWCIFHRYYWFSKLLTSLFRDSLFHN